MLQEIRQTFRSEGDHCGIRHPCPTATMRPRPPSIRVGGHSVTLTAEPRVSVNQLRAELASDVHT
jgi:hypothetical protein